MRGAPAKRERWAELREWGISFRPPPEVPWLGQRGYLRFLRAAARCVWSGHVEPRLRHEYEAVGSRTRVTLGGGCARCGRPIEPRRSRPTQFPRPRATQRWLDQ